MSASSPTTTPARPATLVVSEIYRSIQGESSHVGLPCTLVRLAGCNLRCVWCDSAFSFHGGTRLELPEAMARIQDFATSLVLVTGGEPLLQPDVHTLIASLLECGKTVMLETGGSLSVAGVDPRVIKVMDLKCPASGECHSNLWSNLEHLTRHDEVKFVVADRGDYEWARATIAEHGLGKRCHLLLGVVHGALAPRTLVEWMLEDRLEARFQLQVHKVIWPPDQRRV